MNILIRILLNGAFVYIASALLSGVQVDDFWVAILVGLVLGIINVTVKPILTVLTLPFTILTLGLFLLVINAAMVMLTHSIVPGFQVAGWWSALFFSIIMSLLNLIVADLKKKPQ
ncbi:MAG: phage holin family protein [Bacteroidetes bacterium]|jgi:putative membrane protein|nr:phage holin family protein [Bacteroidota bacterium]